MTNIQNWCPRKKPSSKLYPTVSGYPSSLEGGELIEWHISCIEKAQVGYLNSRYSLILWYARASVTWIFVKPSSNSILASESLMQDRLHNLAPPLFINRASLLIRFHSILLCLSFSFSALLLVFSLLPFFTKSLINGTSLLRTVLCWADLCLRAHKTANRRTISTQCLTISFNSRSILSPLSDLLQPSLKPFKADLNWAFRKYF